MLIPAHNEAGVVGALLADLGAVHYPRELVRVVVLADRCTDETAAVAAAAGVDVRERHRGADGKGALLAWHLDREPLEPDEAVVILDADNRIGPELLHGYADALDAGYDVAQSYLDVSNPEESWLATAGALSYWASNRMVQLARHNLDWGPELGGTGMVLSAKAMTELRPGSFTEDQELTARLMLEGYRIAWLQNSRIYDQKPAALGTAMGQRARWQAGKRDVARRYFVRLLVAGMRRLRWAPVDLAIRLVQPGRTFMVLVAALLAVASLFVEMLWPWWFWAAVVAAQVVIPLPFLARDGVSWRYLVRYPVLAIFGLLWLPIRLMSYVTRGWYHTPH